MTKKKTEKTKHENIILKFITNLLYLIGMGFFGLFYLPYVFVVRLTRSTTEEVRVGKRKVINAVKKNKYIQAQIEKQKAKKDVLLLELATHEEIRSQHKEFFKYVALTSDGKLERGNMRGFSKTDVHEFLLTEGYDVFDIKSSNTNIITKLEKEIADTYKFSYKSLVFILTQLETFLRSGIPLIDSLRILARQTKDANQKMVMMGLVYDISNGLSLSQAMVEQQKAFPNLLVSMIKTAEMTGDLNATLQEMIEYYSEIDKTRRQMKSAVSYPILVLVFTVAVVIFMLVKVVPEFVNMFAQLESDMPPITKLVITSSEFLQKYWWMGLFGVAFVIFIFRFFYANSKEFKYSVQNLIMAMPIFGKVVIYKEITMFTKTFASLLNHNVMITESLEILQNITDNEVYKELILKGINNLAKGDDISKAFKDEKVFPDIAYEMLLTGEKTGEPGKMMARVASYYQEQHLLAVNQIKTFLEPALIVFLAAIVGTILLSVVLPMLDIYSSVQV